MNRFEPRPSPPNLDAQEGWFVQVYGSNRRLLCVLEPTHAWTFFIGCGVGVLLAIVWINAARPNLPLEPVPPTEASILQLD